MNRPRRSLLILLALGTLLLLARLAAPPVALGQTGQPGRPEVAQASDHAVSPPLRTVLPLIEKPGPRDKPLRLVPPNPKDVTDTAVQGAPRPAIAATSGLGFAGVGNGDYGFTPNAAPPDTNMAVGDTQVVQWVNESFAVFNKSTGALVYGPAAGNTLWQSLPTTNGCRQNNDGDPIAQFDRIAHRWVMTQFSVTNPSTYHYLQCVAVSQTADATGAYNLYSFDYGTTQFNDYPKLSVWPDAYYISYNIFTNGGPFAGAKVCALDRTSMLAGNPATQQCFQTSTAYGSLLPSDLDSAMAPPSGEPNLMLNYGSNSLNLWRFHVDWANTANTTFTGPVNIPVSAFNAACTGGGTCIPQPGTTQKLDSLADRLMYRLAYRNFGDHESLVVNHSVTVGTSQSAVRWYELRNPSGGTFGSGTPVVYQQSTYAPDSTYRWMGSIAMDSAGNIAVGYSTSSSSVSPSVAYAARASTDPLSTLGAETTLKAGSGSQTGNLSRWGDYSAMRIDPGDDCTFWYTSEYLKATGAFNWSTWISSFKLAGCGGSSLPTVTSVAPNNGPAAGGTSVTITGTNLLGATAVTFGSTAATSFTCGTATSCTATSPAGSGTVHITVTVGGVISATSAADQFTYNTAPSPCTGATISAGSPASPQAVGTAVSYTATASGCATPQYQFWQYSYATGVWTIVQPWGSSASFTWNTTGLAGGNYLIEVWVRGGTSGSWDAWANSPTYTLQSTAGACTGATISAGSPASPQPVGTMVSYTATASSCATPQYEFWQYSYATAVWTVVQAWGSSASFTWNTSGLATGNYLIEVWVRGGTSGSWDAWANSPTYSLQSTAGACVAATIGAGSPASPQAVGTAVSYTATASGCATPQYQFWQYSYATGVWTIVQPWGSSASFTWNTTGLAGGNYLIEVWVRGGTSGSWDAWANSPTYTLQ